MNSFMRQSPSVPADQMHSFLKDKQAWENAIALYQGPDPLDHWWNYICWYENHGHGDPDNKFRETLERCLTQYEHNDYYKQDVRMVRLWLKYIDMQTNPLHFYQVLHQRGVGKQTACFYLGWAAYYESIQAYKEAEAVFNLAFQEKAQPYAELHHGHSKLMYTKSIQVQQQQPPTAPVAQTATAHYQQTQSSASPNNNGPAPVHQQHQVMTQGQQIQYRQQVNYHAAADSMQQQQPPVAAQHHQTQHTAQVSSQPMPQQQVYIQQQGQSYPTLHTQTVHVQQQQQQQQHYAQQQIPSQMYNNAGQTVQANRQPHEQPQIQQPRNVPVEQQLPAATSNMTREQYEKAIEASNKLQTTAASTATTSEVQIPGIRLPKRFPTYCRNNHETWQPALFLEEPEDPQRICHYPKNIVYPAGMETEYSPEEIKTRRYTVKMEAIRQKLAQQQLKTQQIEQQQHTKEAAQTQQHGVDTIRNDTITYEQATTGVQQHQQYYQQQAALQQQQQQHMQQNNNNHLYYHHHQQQHLQHTQLYSQQHHQLQQQTQPQQHQELAIPNHYNNPPHQTNDYEQQKYHQPQHIQQQQQQQQYYKQNEEEADTEDAETEEDQETEEEYCQQQQNHYVYNQQTNQNHMINTQDDLEDQIEASTIRFSVHTPEQGSQNKTIKIKFKKEKPPSGAAITPNGNNYNAYTIERSYQHGLESPAMSDQSIKRNGNNHNFHPYMLGTTSTPKSSTVNRRQKSKLKKASSKFHMLPSTNSNSSSAENGHTTSTNSHFPTTPTSDTKNYIKSIHNATFNDNANYSFSSAAALDNSNCSLRDATALNHSTLHQTNVVDISTYQENSYFSTQHDAEAKEKRLTKALETIERHMAKEAIDPFSSELCRAFLTKLDFPGADDEAHANYKIIQTPLPKIANAKQLNLPEGIQFNVDKEIGRGSYGSVYKATDVTSGAVVALKFQKPANTWEIYICDQVLKRITLPTVLPGLMDISTAIIAPNASLIATEFSPYGSLLDINNKIRQATTKVMHESLVMHFSAQICSIIHQLHKNKIIHADIKPDNFLLMRVPNTDLHFPSLRLIDFGCAIDMTLFPQEDKTKFRKVIQTDGFTCIEMQEGRSWSYETDLFCIAGTVHVMLFGEYMQIQKRAGTWDIKQKLPRYLKKHVWTHFFGDMLNLKTDSLPNLNEMRKIFEEEAAKMDSELQKQMRTLSNILHRR